MLLEFIKIKLMFYLFKFIGSQIIIMTNWEYDAVWNSLYE